MALAIDVSNVNGAVDWKKVAASGIHAAFIKATEGATFDDSRFPAHRIAATHAGIHVGAYHFARPDRNDPVTEARHFVRVVGKPTVTELRPVLDFETPAHLTSEQMVGWARKWMQEVERLTGVWPLFYSYPNMIEGLHATRVIGDGLWLASYGPNDGKEHPVVVPRPFKRAFVHQFTSNGHVPGVSGKVDVNSFAKLTPLLAHPVRSIPVRLVRRIGGTVRA